MDGDSVKKYVLVVLFFLAATIFALPEIVEKWMYANYYAKRIMVEIGLKSRFRYEEVYKWGADKMVLVHEPVSVNWVRLGQSCYMGSGTTLKRSPMLILDLEDLAFKEILQGRDLKIEETNEGYEIYIHDTGEYRVLLSSDGFPKEIERNYMDTKSKLIYEEVKPLSADKNEILKDYTLVDSGVEFPKELVDILSNFRFLIIREGTSGLEIEGIYKNGQKVEIFIGNDLPKGGLQVNINGLKIAIVADEKTLEEIKVILGQ
ncbi:MULTISPECIES: hypothetical protein [Thermotoga]|uniref:DUF4340 domain-containing protein n=1 Tax=Thermotoga maritima (strain ATCC 43589 / DSM 3109 / JCM 10099 / NBRC 100826 / MSB8) TaxID=243274 RepID=Q9X1T6_THEMA|nr:MULTISPECIES: hypothetical protein [Thermotoga]AIY88527.1 hypothetical protein CELL2_06275 [Thermotoga sp. Cell2]KHC95146.1 hypothetical protein XYL54_08764 [Thermotoga sp. Xyl54]AAD36667.1 hypothetical protein TM_1600 [Thermotoga maritima MSB8]AGL50532.1 hypothetical protein Tmari_1608 [Thermotoga maritima MSB8]AHD18504.1 hypothetical protein THEMA_06250 [Thermotoga maritima MSB8]